MTPRFKKKSQFKVNFSYLSKIRVYKIWNTHLLIQNELRVNYDVTATWKVSKFGKLDNKIVKLKLLGFI